MIAPRYWPLVFKQVVRQRSRSLLTALGVATAMFLFCAIQALQAGVREATAAGAADQWLIVYRENRYCPSTSRLPERYASRIAGIPGVAGVLPIKILVNNCRASLDVVTHRGVPPEAFQELVAPRLRVLQGSLEAFQSRSDAAVLGETLAARRGLKAGDRFEANGLAVYVAAVAASDEPQDRNVCYVQLGFLQRAPGSGTQGTVTQFNVRLADPSKQEAVARAIDAELALEPEPTQTRAEKAFVARVASDLLELLRFTHWLGAGCLLAVAALIANTLALAVRSRVREHAILQTLGYRSFLIARLVVAEGLVLSLAGGLAGLAGALAVLRAGQFSLSNEGFSIGVGLGPEVWLTGLLASLALGVLASLFPAWQAARQEIAGAFRAV